MPGGNAANRSFYNRHGNVVIPCRFSRRKLRACLHDGGGPQVGEVTRVGGVTRLSIQSLILM